MRRQNGAERPYKRIQGEQQPEACAAGCFYIIGARCCACVPERARSYAAYAAASSVRRPGAAARHVPPGRCLFLLCLFLLFISYLYSYILIIIYLCMYLLYICVYIYLSIYICPPLLALAAAAAPHMNTRTSARRADHTTATPGAMQKNKGDSPSKKRV